MSAPSYTPLSPDAAGLAAAGARLRGGGCVAFPTETVYGLGAHALDAAAVARVFAFKGRPLSDPLIVHLPTPASALALLRLPRGAAELAAALGAAFWPGPLTIVGRAVAEVPLSVTAGTGWVGVRVPRHPLALALLRAAGVPIAAPSANLFGHVSPTCAAHVIADLGHCEIGVLMGEEAGAAEASAAAATCAVGIESTVVRVECAESGEASGRAAAGAEAGGAEAGAQASPLAGVRLTVFRRGGVSEAALRAACARAAAAAGVPHLCVPIAFACLHEPAGGGGGGSQEAQEGGAGGGGEGGGGEGGAVEAPAEGRRSGPAGGVAGSIGGAGAALGSVGGAGAALGSVSGAGAALGSVGGAAAALNVAGSVGSADAADPALPPGAGAPAPGMLLSHYAPSVPAWLATGCGSGAGFALPPPHALASAVVIDVAGTLRAAAGGACAYRDIAPGGSLTAACAGLFAALRWAEGVPGASCVLMADPLAATGRGSAAEEGREHADALRDRMFRAASGRSLGVPVE